MDKVDTRRMDKRDAKKAKDSKVYHSKHVRNVLKQLGEEKKKAKNANGKISKYQKNGFNSKSIPLLKKDSTNSFYLFYFILSSSCRQKWVKRLKG